MQAFDTSAIVYAWEKYPKSQFPLLWEWLALRIRDNEIVIPEAALLELSHVERDCFAWLTGSSIQRLKTTNEVMERAQQLTKELEVTNGEFSARGVDQNDLIIIAASELAGAKSVTEESVQNNKPLYKKNSKIPAVCDLPLVHVCCLNFLDVITQSGKTFG